MADPDLERAYAKHLLSLGIDLETISNLLDLADVVEELRIEGISDTAEFQNKVKAISTQHSSLNGFWGRSLQADLEDVIKAYSLLGLTPSRPIYIGELPALEINAKIRRESSCDLVLVNSAVPTYLSHIAILVAAYTLGDAVPGQQPLSRESFEIQLVIETLNLLHHDLQFSTGLPQQHLTDAQQFLAAVLMATSIRFLIAHEVSHAVRQHLVKSGNSLKMELLADEDAYNASMKLAIPETEQEDHEIYRKSRELHHAGILFFLNLFLLLDDVMAHPDTRLLLSLKQHVLENGVAVPIEILHSTHPTSAERISQVKIIAQKSDCDSELAILLESALMSSRELIIDMIGSWSRDDLKSRIKF